MNGWVLDLHLTGTITPPSTKPDVTLRWHIGPVATKPVGWTPAPPSLLRHPPTKSETTMQLTADQQVTLTVSGTDAYGNPTNISGDGTWLSSDEAIIQVTGDDDSAVATAVGPIGTASVTYTNDVDQDGSGDFIGSLAIDVVGGAMTAIVLTPSEPVGKDVVPDNTLPDEQPG
jgi:hypothetical protein